MGADQEGNPTVEARVVLRKDREEEKVEVQREGAQ